MFHVPISCVAAWNATSCWWMFNVAQSRTVSSWTLTISGLAGAIRSKLIDPFTYLHTYVRTYIHTYVHTYIRTYEHTLHSITLHYIPVPLPLPLALAFALPLPLHYNTIHTYTTSIHPSIHAGRMTIIHTRVDIHGNSTQEKRLRGFKTSHEWSLIHRYKYIYIYTHP